tara:strand:+ start:1895 stop:2044 length:150 start_codon:yes stop_codon:yes gene_type:complete
MNADPRKMKKRDHNIKDAKVIIVVGAITAAIWVTWVVTRWLPYGVGTIH